MTTQRGLEPHEYTPYAAYSDGPCRHCERGRYAAIHEQARTVPDTPYANAVLGMRERRARELAPCIHGIAAGKECYRCRIDAEDTQPRTEQPASAAGSRCYCGHLRENHNNEGMCPLSAIAYQYARFPGDEYCKCEGFVLEQQPPTPAAQETGKWRVTHDGPSRPVIETSDGRLLSLSQFQYGRWESYEREEQDCAQIVRDHNQHQSLSAERERLREVNRRLAEVLRLSAVKSPDDGPCWCAVDPRVFGHGDKCRQIRTALNEQGKELG